MAWFIPLKPTKPTTTETKLMQITSKKSRSETEKFFNMTAISSSKMSHFSGI
jgi:hypothetical protein